MGGFGRLWEGSLPTMYIYIITINTNNITYLGGLGGLGGYFDKKPVRVWKVWIRKFVHSVWHEWEHLPTPSLPKIKMWGAKNFLLYIWLKQKEKVKLKLKFFFSWHENFLSCDENFLLYIWLKHFVFHDETKGKGQVETKIFFIIYMTETKCGPSTNKMKRSTSN